MKKKVLSAIAVVCIVCTMILIGNGIDLSPTSYNSGDGFRRAELQNKNPYAIFGIDAVVLMTEAERNSDHILEIVNDDPNDPVSRMELDMRTGVTRLFDKDGNLTQERLLDAKEKARWLKQDRFAEKYYSHSPYSYAIGNPVRFIDINGDSISVDEQYRDQYNSSLSDVFGVHASNFSYTESGMLVYSGNSQDLNRQQRKILKGMSKVMAESTITEIHYTDTHTMTDNAGNKTSINLKGLRSDGVAILGSENNMDRNYIVISPTPSPTINVDVVTDAYYSYDPLVPGGPARFQSATVPTNSTDLMFHELGHVVYQGRTQDRVLDFNNIVRTQIGLPKRPYDETHNRKVRQGMY